MSSFGGTRASLGGRSLAKAYISAKEVYSFPILEAEEIADVLREMGAAVSDEDFAKPNASTFRQYCELFVQEILGVGKEELYQAHPEFAEALDGTEDLHEASIPIIHFIRNMNKVLASARCDEGLSLRDLIKPERARVLRVLSALVNLQKFKVEKLIWYREQEEKKVRSPCWASLLGALLTAPADLSSPPCTASLLALHPFFPPNPPTPPPTQPAHNKLRHAPPPPFLPRWLSFGARRALSCSMLMCAGGWRRRSP